MPSIPGSLISIRTTAGLILGRWRRASSAVEYIPTNLIPQHRAIDMLSSSAELGSSSTNATVWAGFSPSRVLIDTPRQGNGFQAFSFIVYVTISSLLQNRFAPPVESFRLHA